MALTIPPFFKNVGRGNERIWEELISTSLPMVINWSRLDDEKKQQLMPTLSTTENWILLTPGQQLGKSNKLQPPFQEAKLVARAHWKKSKHYCWWQEGQDELATHSMTTEMWMSTKGRMLEATRIPIQEASEAENSKDTPSFGTEDLENLQIHRLGTEAGLLGNYSFPTCMSSAQPGDF